MMSPSISLCINSENYKLAILTIHPVNGKFYNVLTGQCFYVVLWFTALAAMIISTSLYSIF